MANFFDVTRTTIASWIEDLTQYGLDVHKVRGKGYRLSTAMTLLSKEQLLEYLPSNITSDIASIDIALETDSTNRLALQSQYSSPDWKVFASEFQHSGRGRRGNDWISPLGANLLFSVASKRQWSLPVLYMASLIAGLALARTLSSLLAASVKVKWPNDIYINDRKVAGILCELQGTPQDESLLVIGIGVNVDAWPQNIDREATSIRSHMSKDISRTELLAKILSNLISSIQEANALGNYDVLKGWSEFDYLKDKPIKIIQGENEYQGTANGIDHQGQLRVNMDDGSIKVFNAGEVSVRWQ